MREFILHQAEDLVVKESLTTAPKRVAKELKALPQATWAKRTGKNK